MKAAVEAIQTKIDAQKAECPGDPVIRFPFSDVFVDRENGLIYIQLASIKAALARMDD